MNYRINLLNSLVHTPQLQDLAHISQHLHPETVLGIKH